MFQAVDAYVTPAWYATKRETGKVVPTWNYVHIQIKGRASVQDNADFVRALRTQGRTIANRWLATHQPELGDPAAHSSIRQAAMPSPSLRLK